MDGLTDLEKEDGEGETIIVCMQSVRLHRPEDRFYCPTERGQSSILIIMMIVYVCAVPARRGRKTFLGKVFVFDFSDHDLPIDS